MPAPHESRRLLGRRSIPRSTAGVGLVELMVVVLIISMLMALAVPSYQRVRKRAKAGAIVNDFRVFSAVYLSYAHENGHRGPRRRPPGSSRPASPART
jgi:type II secretory pathway pseudopilin PulG